MMTDEEYATRLATLWNLHYRPAGLLSFEVWTSESGRTWGVQKYYKGEPGPEWSIARGDSGVYASTATDMIRLDYETLVG